MKIQITQDDGTLVETLHVQAGSPPDDGGETSALYETEEDWIAQDVIAALGRAFARKPDTSRGDPIKYDHACGYGD